MAITSHSNGHEIKYVNGEWEKDLVICKKCGKKNVLVNLCTPRHCSNLNTAKVDACIAPLIQILNDFGVKTRNCCCGHGEYQGIIIIEQDNERIDLKLKNDNS